MSQAEPELEEEDRRSGKRWFLLGVGVAVFAFILWQIDVDALGDVFVQMDVELFVVACATLLLTLFVRSLRWRLLLSDLDDETPGYGTLTLIYAYAAFIGTATPGRVGEFVKILHLRQFDIETGVAVATVLTDRAMDVGTLVAIAFVASLVMFVPGASLLYVSLVVAVGFLLLTGAWLLLRSHRVDDWLRSLGEAGDAGAIARGIAWAEERTRDVREAFRSQSLGALLVALFLSFAGWGVVYTANYFIAVGLDIELNYLQVAGASALTSLAAQLPVSVMGVGTREAAMVAVLAPLGVVSEEAVALSLLFLASILVFALVCAVSLLSPRVRAVAESNPATDE